jgi:prefoldin subunit 5
MMNEIDPILTARELATHANDIQHLQDDMDRLIEDMEEVKKALVEIRNLLAENNAEKKTWHTVFTIGAGLVGGAVVWIIDKLFK